jgi:hypothetical protein
MTKERRTGANSTFAIGGVSCSADSFVVTESSVLRINICAKKPAHRKSANRYGRFLEKSEVKILTKNENKNEKFIEINRLFYGIYVGWCFISN